MSKKTDQTDSVNIKPKKMDQNALTKQRKGNVWGRGKKKWQRLR